MNEDSIQTSRDASERSLDLAFDKGLQMAFPPVMLHLLQALLDPAPSFSSIAGFLKMDPMLAGKILHIVNTSSYGFRQKVTDLQRAAIAIGTSDLFKLIISLSLQKRLYPMVKRNPELIFGDWRVTLWSALSAEALADHFCPEQKREAYLAGTLKDLPLLLGFCRESVPAFLQEERLATIPFPGQSALETQVWGRTHQEMSHDIFLYWGMPKSMAEAVYMHHDMDNVGQLPPLAKTLVYATRWAELLHGDNTDPGQLVAFELGLAAELGFDLVSMENFRASCAERFNLLLSQLSIQNARPETRLHDQSLSSLQNYYFLALGILSELYSASAGSMVTALQRQLRLFWNITTWNLSITLPGNRQTLHFHCDEGVLQEEKLAFTSQSACPSQWTCLPIAYERSEFGLLSFPKQEEAGQNLPMFLHMIGLCLKENQRTGRSSSRSTRLGSLPFIIAGINEEGTIKEASATFLDTLGLQDIPKGHRPGSLLNERLGINPEHVEKALQTEGYSGRFLSAPEGAFPGTPVFLGTCRNRQKPGESYLFLGDVNPLSSLQTVALAHPEFLETLLHNIHEQVCLIGKDGIILWADPRIQGFVKQNIFAIAQPDSLPQKNWSADFLTGLDKAIKVKVRIHAGGATHPVTMTVAPVPETDGQYIVLLQKTGRAQESVLPIPPAKQRDPLTGLYGYSQFHMLLKHASDLAAKQLVHTGILFCNLDSLRTINHKYGYRQGDTVLLKTGECLAAACRAGKDYPCRYGSDKFAIIATHATTAIMETMAKSIQDSVGDLGNPLAKIHIGLSLVPPGLAPRPYLDAAREAAKVAILEESHIRWAE